MTSGPHKVSKQLASCMLTAYKLALYAPLHTPVYILSIKKHIVEKKSKFHLYITFKQIKTIHSNIQICFPNEHLLGNNKIVTFIILLCNRNIAARPQADHSPPLMPWSGICRPTLTLSTYFQGIMLKYRGS